jgi:NAD(P)-dependent dehydrogenase (short-subunit alcohol dehydrogenase family)
MSIPIDLSGQVALVTGGGSGIGEAIATTLAQAGAGVAVADLSQESATRVAESIRGCGGKAQPIQMDIANPASVEAGIALVRAELGPVSILVNNAATWVVKEFKETTSAEVARVIDVTLIGTINVTRAALPDVIEQRGRIINTISDSARIGERYMSVYAAAKAGLMGLTKSLAREVGRDGVTVNGVSPGTTSTPGSSAFIEAAGGPEKLARAYPLGRIGEPADIANAVLFFASPLSSWITGQILSVSGGFTMVG